MQNAEVLTKFTADTKDYDSKVKNVNKTSSSIASGISSAFKVATAAITGATVAVGALVKKSVDYYAEFEQLEGGLVSLFGDGSNEMNRIIKKSEEAYKDLTMSQNEYLTSFQSAYPLVNAGLSDNADSIEYTNKMLQISSDLFNTYGGSVEQYQNAINWALKGSFVYLDNLNLGIKGTQEGFIEAANASGVLNRNIQKVNELTSDEIIDVISHYADEYGVLGKTAQEAGDTILGSLNMMKASWKNFVTGFSKGGDNLDKLIDNLVDSAMKFGENILPIIERALVSIVNVLPKVIDKLVSILPGLLEKLLPPLITSAISLINGLVKALPQIIPILIAGIVQALKGIADVLPTLVTAFVEGLVILMEALAEQAPVIIPILVQAILDGLMTLLDHMDVMIEAGYELLVGLSIGIIKAIPMLIAKIPQIIYSIIKGLNNGLVKIQNKGKDFLKEFIKGFLQGIGNVVNVGKDIINGIIKGLNNMKNAAIDKAKNIGKAILGGIKNVLGIHSPSTEFALIGKFSVLGFTEQLDKMKKTIQSQVADTFELSPQLTNSASLHYSPKVNVSVYNSYKQDALGQMVNDIKTFSGGAKNDFNYGAGA
jgi:hypothetical protein